MKKETNYSVIYDRLMRNETGNKIPKGFVKYTEITKLFNPNEQQWDDFIEEYENKLYMEKSIYDKRVNDVFNYCEFWSNEDKLKAKKILIEGVNDEKRN